MPFITKSADEKMHLLVGVTGSVAAIKIEEILQSVKTQTNADDIDVHIKIVLTEAAQHFVDIESMKKQHEVYTDKDEWSSWSKKGDPVLHIELRKWATVFAVCPLDANTLAKAANGMCDNLLTSVIRAWDYDKPMMLFPAMNTQMWESQFTSAHLSTLQSLGARVIPPVSKTLACGDEGMGALPEVHDVSTVITDVLSEHLYPISPTNRKK